MKNIVVNSPQFIFTFLCFTVLIAIDFVCQAKISAFDNMLLIVSLDCISNPAYHFYFSECNANIFFSPRLKKKYGLLLFRS